MGRLIFTKRASSSTPEAGKVALYAKNDGKLYKKTEDGVEEEVGAGGGGGGEPVDYPITLDKGGTGATTAQGALNALTNVSAASAGYVLTKVGANVAWAAASNGSGSEAGLPNPAGSNANDVVVSNGNAQYTLVDDTTFVSAAGAVMKSSFPARGSLVAGTGAGTTGFLQAGTNGKVLVANSAAASGLEWQDRVMMITGTSNTVPRITGQGIITASGITITAADVFVVPATGNLVSNGPVFANAGLTVQGNIGVSGTVDGRDVSVDGVKLDAIKKDNTTATTDPGNANNTSQGYAAGSRWINTSATPAKLFVCTAATSNSATWKLAGAPVDGITKTELASYGTDITPVNASTNLTIGTKAGTYASLVVGATERGFIELSPQKPANFQPAYGTNVAAAYHRMRGARGLFIGNQPAIVQVFSTQTPTQNLVLPAYDPNAANTFRYMMLKEFTSTATGELVPFQAGYLQFSCQMRATIVPRNLDGASSLPQFRWFLVISKNKATAPFLEESNDQLVNGSGAIAASGIVYAPVYSYESDTNITLNEDCNIHFNLGVDLTVNESTGAWTSRPTGVVCASNRNEEIGTSFGFTRSSPTSDLVYSLGTLTTGTPWGFNSDDTPRLSLWISQSGTLGISKFGINNYGYARGGVKIKELMASATFAPRLVDRSGPIATPQYRTSNGGFAAY